jgi:hypothetical protein
MVMGPLTFTTLLILSWHPGVGSVQSLSDDVCRVSRCREAQRIKIELGDGIESEIQAPRSPIIQDGFATIFMGERLALALEAAPDGTYRVTAPLDEPPPDKKLTLSLRQERLQPGKRKVTLLEVTSSVGATIHYEAYMSLVPGQPLKRTSVCPLRQNVVSLEMWPHVIPQLLVKNFVVVAEGTPCK